MSALVTRRALIGGLATATLSGCDALGRNESFRSLLSSAEKGNYALHRLLQDRTALAREYAPHQRSPVFRANGTRVPAGPEYAAHMAAQFADWRLIVDGLVARPQSIALNAVRAMPARQQITRHDCVEGWSAIGKWTGVPLRLLLEAAGLRQAANFIVFHCADMMGNGAVYYESIDRVDAMHPQTILAWALNDQMLPVVNGAPLRLRVERQLGYTHAKYVQRIEAVASLDGVYGGKGGYWEDGAGYEWYAGI